MAAKGPARASLRYAKAPLSPRYQWELHQLLGHCYETMFRNLAHARVVIPAWATGYNTERPHSALNYQTPADYARTLTTAIARPDTRDESSACRAIAQPAPIGVNINRAQVTAG